ncbi:hypothetical protein [Konateibacter massiliensis]|uniref:hypothetical protein n=1 Tax=Konateibacter massiliensis TaxID=2002841 RepID=UPI000C1575F9|nr:hypothetical protein [Konateibacter massiliensis]
MEKLELKSGEQIEIQNGASENFVSVEVESLDAFKELYNKFTDDNLSQISFLNDEGVLCNTFIDKTLSSAKLETVTDEDAEVVSLVATFNLKNIDSTTKRIKYLEDTVDALILNSLEVE